MKKRNFNKVLVIFIGVIFTFTSILFISSMYSISNSYAQEKTANIGADKIKAILLGQKKWIGEFHHERKGSNMVDYVFEDRGKKMIVKIDNPSREIHCKRKVKINSDNFRMVGCYVGIAELFYDPYDPIYPFKTKGDNLEYSLKLKAQ